MNEVLKRRLIGGAVLLVLLISTTLLFFRGGPDTGSQAKAPAEVKTYALEVPPPADAMAPSPDTKQVGTIPPSPEEAPKTGDEGDDDTDTERPIPSKAPIATSAPSAAPAPAKPAPPPAPATAMVPPSQPV